MTTTYIVIVLPTSEMGSYRARAQASRYETMRANALWRYNRARAHDNLPPLSRMPAGTTYRREVK